jgi:uncharacterized protein (TIGR02466 family)
MGTLRNLCQKTTLSRRNQCVYGPDLLGWINFLNKDELAANMSGDRWTASYHTLFPTPLFSFQLLEHTEMDQVLLSLIYQLKSQDGGMTASNVLGWHSRGNLFEVPAVHPFRELVTAAIAECANALGYNQVPIRPANCWANVNPKYASNKIHDHANCLFSGVYYLKAPENCGNLMFYDPREARTFYKPAVKEFTTYTADAVAHAAQEGVLLIFPSWLKHGVEPNLSDTDRISISFNYVFG